MADPAVAAAESVSMCKDVVRVSGGGAETTFGELCRDDIVEQRYEALLGTLKAARKRGLLTFEGELLLLGQHNDVVVALTEAGAGAAAGNVTEDVAEELATLQAATSAALEEPAALAAEVVVPPVEDNAAAPAAAAVAEVIVPPVEDNVPVASINLVVPQKINLVVPPEAPTVAEAMPSVVPPEAPPAAELPSPADAGTQPHNEEEAQPHQEEAQPRKEEEAQPDDEEDGEEGGRKWKVDTGYIDYRTADPDRLEGRRQSQPTGAASLPSGGAANAQKDEDGKWTAVDVSYINHRTAEVDNLKIVNGEQAAGSLTEMTNTASATTRKESDGKWKVDTSYINNRTADVENLEQKQDAKLKVASGEQVDGSLTNVTNTVSATTRKESDGRWKVDTSYINNRTADVENLEQKQEVKQVGTASAPVSSTVKKDSEGKWKVDVTYINYRTGDTENLTKNVEELHQANYADPAEKKYTYEELKGGGNRPDDVDPKFKELYFSDAEFETVFGMAAAAFQKFPKWKQQNLKKAKDVF